MIRSLTQGRARGPRPYERSGHVVGAGLPRPSNAAAIAIALAAVLAACDRGPAAPPPPAPETDLRSQLKNPLAHGLLAQRLFDESPASTIVLLPLLRDADPEVRAASASLLGTLGAREAVPALAAASRDPDPLVRAQAVAALGAIGSLAPAEALKAAFADLDPRVRRQAAAAAGRSDPPGLRPNLRALLRDPADPVRFSAARALGTLRDAESGGALAGIALDPKSHPAVRIAAAAALGRISDPAAVGALRTLERDPDPDVSQAASRALLSAGAVESDLVRRSAEAPPEERLDAIHTLAFRNGPESLERLRFLADSDDPDIRATAMDALAIRDTGASGGKPPNEPVERALASEDPRIRRAAVHAALRRDASFGPWMEKAANDPDAIVRRILLDACERLGPDASLGALRALLSDAEEDIASRAASILGASASAAARDALLSAFEPALHRVRTAILAALAARGDDPATLGLFRRILEKTDSDVAHRTLAARRISATADATDARRLRAILAEESADPQISIACAEGLGERRDAAAVPVLEKALLRDEPYVQRAAISALGRIGQPGSTARIRPFLKAERGIVRAAACEALGRLGDASDAEALAASVSDSEASVRATACLALGRLPPSAASAAALNRASSDREPSVRKAAVAALAEAAGRPR